MGGGVKIVEGSSSFNTAASSSLQVENATTNGEAAWLRGCSASNTTPVISLIKQGTGTGNFLQCWDESAGPSFTSKCHVDSNGSFVSGSDFAESLLAVGHKSDYAPGDVLIISASQPGGSRNPVARLIAPVIGVYSTRPGFVGADKNGITEVRVDEIPVAITWHRACQSLIRERRDSSGHLLVDINHARLRNERRAQIHPSEPLSAKRWGY